MYSVQKLGVIIDNKFTSVLNSCSYLTSAHFTFFCNLFEAKKISNRKCLIADCYLWSDFLPTQATQIDRRLINKDVLNENQKLPKRESAQDAFNQTNTYQPTRPTNTPGRNQQKTELQSRTQINNHQQDQDLGNGMTKLKSEARQQQQQQQQKNTSVQQNAGRQDASTKFVQQEFRQDAQKQNSSAKPQLVKDLMPTQKNQFQQQQEKEQTHQIQSKTYTAQGSTSNKQNTGSQMSEGRIKKTQTQNYKSPPSTMLNSKSSKVEEKQSDQKQPQNSEDLEILRVQELSMLGKIDATSSLQSSTGGPKSVTDPTPPPQIQQKKNPVRIANEQVRTDKVEVKEGKEDKQSDNAQNYHFKIVKVTVVDTGSDRFQLRKLDDYLRNVRARYNLAQGCNVFDQFDMFFMPINIGNSHWICSIAYPQDRSIYYLDSLQEVNNEIVNGIKLMLNHGRNKEVEWTLNFGMPQQTNNYDCGVFVLRALYEVIFYDRKVTKTSFNQADVTKFRENLYRETLQILQQ